MAVKDFFGFTDGTDTYNVNDKSKAPLTLLDDTVGWDCRNVLDTRIETLKKINTTGTWSGNAYTNDGVTYTVSDNGIATSGTSNALTYFNLDTSFDTAKYAGWLINGLPSGGGNGSFLFRISASTSDRTGIQDFETAEDAPIQNNGSGKCLAIRIANGYNTSGKVFQPMVHKTEYANLPFQPHHPPVSEWGYTREEANVLGAKNLNRGDVSHTYIKGTARTSDAFPMPFPFKVGDKYTVSFDIEDSANFATSNGLGVKFIYSTGTDAATALDAGNTNGHIEHTFTISANSSDNPRLYFFISNAETNANATLKVNNLMIRLATDTDDTYEAPAMTNRELTEKKADDICGTGNHKITMIVSALTTSNGKTPELFIPYNNPQKKSIGFDTFKVYDRTGGSWNELAQDSAPTLQVARENGFYVNLNLTAALSVNTSYVLKIDGNLVFS